MDRLSNSDIIECLDASIKSLAEAQRCLGRASYELSIELSYNSYYFAMQALALVDNPGCEKLSNVTSAFIESYVQTGKLSVDYYTFFMEFCKLTDTLSYVFVFVSDRNTVVECLEASKKMLVATVDILKEIIDVFELDLESVLWVRTHLGCEIPVKFSKEIVCQGQAIFSNKLHEKIEMEEERPNSSIIKFSKKMESQTNAASEFNNKVERRLLFISELSEENNKRLTVIPNFDDEFENCKMVGID